MGSLLLIESRLEDQAGDTLVIQTQLLALQVQSGLRHLARTGQVQAAIDAAAQAGPQLVEFAQGDIHLALQLLIQSALPLDTVVAQAQIQSWQLPERPRCAGLELQHRRLITQLALQLDARVRVQIFSLQATFAAQRAAQQPRQFGNPVGRIELLQLQGGFPTDGIGEAQTQLPFGAALP